MNHVDLGAAKEKITTYMRSAGVDAVGFANLRDYHSPKSPVVTDFFPQARSIIVLAYKELSSCASTNLQLAMNGRMDLMEFSRSCNYKLARFLESEFRDQAMTVPVSYPLEMSKTTGGAVGEVSLRHAAHAAGLGVFGRNNLILHPKFGSRVIFSAVLSTLDFSSDPRLEDELCTYCDICVESCPAGALDVEGKTHVNKCLRHSQPYGLGGAISFWSKIAESSPEEQKKLLMDDHFWRLYQAQIIGFQYCCFNCLSTCPLGD
jgi:epoxyqueuosine reductase QueG